MKKNVDVIIVLILVYFVFVRERTIVREHNNNVLSEDVKMTESLFLLAKCLFFVVAYINMINDTPNLT